MAESNGRLLGKRLLQAFRGYVARSIAPLVTKLKELETTVKAIKPERGEKGEVGAVGPAGAQGPTGQAGMDALQLNILPTLDFQRSYPRGTYARHQGGIWRSFEDTAGTRGWECLVVGVHEVTLEQKDERHIVLGISLTSGTKIEKEFVMPVVLDRGVYSADTKYQKGDGVTWAGSWWIAQVDEPTEKPGEPPAGAPTGYKGQWRLAVKRGRDGKDAK